MAQSKVRGCCPMKHDGSFNSSVKLHRNPWDTRFRKLIFTFNIMSCLIAAVISYTGRFGGSHGSPSPGIPVARVCSCWANNSLVGSLSGVPSMSNSSLWFHENPPKCEIQGTTFRFLDISIVSSWTYHTCAQKVLTTSPTSIHIKHIIEILWLVVSPPLKNMKVSWEYEISTWMEKCKPCSKPPTRFILENHPNFI